MNSLVVTNRNEISEKVEFPIEEFTPEIFDCEADGSCGNGHIHITITA